jgi:putative ABC transport system ATP-binding protein
MRLLVDLGRERELTIVMVTHEDETAAYADRVVEFRDGRVLGAPDVQTGERVA